MDWFALAFLTLAAASLAGALYWGLVLFRVRAARRERLQMKQHLRRMGLAGH